MVVGVVCLHTIPPESLDILQLLLYILYNEPYIYAILPISLWTGYSRWDAVGTLQLVCLQMRVRAKSIQFQFKTRSCRANDKTLLNTVFNRAEFLIESAAKIVCFFFANESKKANGYNWTIWDFRPLLYIQTTHLIFCFPKVLLLVAIFFCFRV